MAAVHLYIISFTALMISSTSEIGGYPKCSVNIDVDLIVGAAMAALVFSNWLF
ncbi:YAL034C-B-like protein [Saccharomyces kudriavzevii IFO 1802]|uniref:YAL034C-B-like protein n=1 Tax=Saccharomyces kudriavzevii (strain ATCC MYA-4449 / AS 2.2408 / CBS 8840 / NBRC 1802 / NCYC 2889) TaxID=226230 RepID=J6EHL1_SACK1|nr:YAL034C-B-like protein [Saccharomyces kudriavzevii IFO 1802]